MLLQVKGIRCLRCVFADALRLLGFSSQAKVEAEACGEETKNEDRNSIKLDGWHVSFVGNGRCRFIVADIILARNCVCVCALSKEV